MPCCLIYPYLVLSRLEYINLIDKCLSKKEGSHIWKFADDTKLARIIERDEDKDELQGELSRLVEWTETWMMQFNEKKCKVLHMGRKNPRYDYIINSRVLEKTEDERDLGVIISSNLKPAAKCNKADKKAWKLRKQKKRLHIKQACQSKHNNKWW